MHPKEKFAMKKHVHILVLALCLLCGTTAQAEVIRLKSGKEVTGTILLRNEEVVVFRDASGKRFQYPMHDIEVILTDEEAAQRQLNQSKSDQADENVNVQAYNAPKASICLGIYGGGMAIPATQGSPAIMGGCFGADFSVGSYSLLGRRVFLGGGLGYHGVILNGKTLNFLPIQLRAEVPLMQTRHAPLLGMSVGYGIGMKDVTGGIYSSLLFGWKASFGRKGGFFLGLTGDVQSARIQMTETISGKEYRSEVQRVLCGFGARMALYF